MTDEARQPKGKVAKGQVWFHQGRASEPYRVLDVLDNATGYEATGQIARQIVVYVQEYDGQVAKRGKHWVRDLDDFLGFTEVNGQPVPNFVLKKEK